MKIIVFMVAVLLCTAVNAGSYQDLQPGQWIEIGTNSIEDIDPEDSPATNPNYCDSNGDGRSDCAAPYHATEGISAVMEDWNGGAFATNYGSLGGLIAWGGGHSGYFGNEVYIFDIAANRWARLSDPYYPPGGGSMPASVCSQDTGKFADGSPCSAHIYDQVEYHPGTNSFVILGNSSLHEKGGGGAPTVFLFSLDTNTWRTGQSHPTQELQIGSSTAYDAARDLFWMIPTGIKDVSSYDVDKNDWTLHGSDVNQNLDAISAFDSDRDLIVTLDHKKEDKRFLVRRAGNPSVSFSAKFTGPDDLLHSSKDDNTRPGFEYDPVNRVFVGWRGGRDIYTVRPPDGDPQTGTWVVTRVSMGGVTPSLPTKNGVYSRMRFVPKLGAFIVANRTSEGAYMFQVGECTNCPEVDTVAPASPTGVDTID